MITPADMDAAIREALIEYETRPFCFVRPFEWHRPPGWSYEHQRADERMEHVPVKRDAP